MSHNGRRAVLRAKDVGLLDTFQFGGSNLVPSTANIYARWDATGARQSVGKGLGVPGTDPAAFRGSFAPARCVSIVSGQKLGFSYASRQRASSDLGYAAIGHERNGVFLE